MKYDHQTFFAPIVGLALPISTDLVAYLFSPVFVNLEWHNNFSQPPPPKKNYNDEVGIAYLLLFVFLGSSSRDRILSGRSSLQL